MTNLNCLFCGKILTGRQKKFCSCNCGARFWNKANYKANSEKIKANRRAPYLANPERYKAKSKAWKSANPERVKANKKAWVKANPERVRNNIQNFRDLHPGYDYLHYRMRKIIEKPESCQICHEKKDKLHLASVEHVYSENINDWIWLCVSCHRLYDCCWKLKNLSLVCGVRD